MEKFNPIQDRIARKHDMWEQHTEFNRLGYDGHNRRSGLITSRTLKRRRNRRRMERWMGEAVKTANGEVVRQFFEPGFDSNRPQVIEPFVLTRGMVYDVQARERILPLIPPLQRKAS